MRSAAASSAAAAAKTPDREGVIAVLPDPQTLDRVLGIFRDLQIGDELHIEATPDAALRRVREGAVPRVLLLDLSRLAGPDCRAQRRADGRRRRAENRRAGEC